MGGARLDRRQRLFVVLLTPAGESAVDPNLCHQDRGDAALDGLGGARSNRGRDELERRPPGPDLNLHLFGRYLLNVFPPFGCDPEVRDGGASLALAAPVSPPAPGIAAVGVPAVVVADVFGFVAHQGGLHVDQP